MTDERWFMKEPCQHCPFRRDVPPFLHPERGAQLAGLTENRYSDFLCHKTTVPDEESEWGEMRVTAKSLTCAGFLSMQIEWGGAPCPPGFEPSEAVYSEPGEMIDAYADPSR